MQGEACARRSQGASGDTDHLLGVRRGNHGSIQADTGAAGAVPVVFSEAGRSCSRCLAGRLKTGPKLFQSRIEKQISQESWCLLQGSMPNVGAVVDAFKFNLSHGLIGAVQGFFKGTPCSRNAQHTPTRRNRLVADARRA